MKKLVLTVVAVAALAAAASTPTEARGLGGLRLPELHHSITDIAKHLLFEADSILAL